MARKKGEPKMPATAAEPKLKPVRVDFDPADHHDLRVVAAEAGLSMAAFSKLVILEAVKARKKRGSER